MTAVAVEKVRIPFVQRASLSLSGATREAVLVDLGLEGVFVETREPLAPGDAVEITFRLPGNAIPLASRGRVAWVHAGGSHSPLPAGVGVQFVAMAPEDRGRLREYLEDYCRRHGRARRFARPWPQAAGAQGGGA
jgi:uncharacterized protein (TIGR02266 family)